MMGLLELRNVTVRYGTRTVLDSVSCSVKAGEWLMVIGPNGAGKSTMIRAVTGTAPYDGGISVEGVPIETIKPRELAKKIAVLTQNNSVSYSFTVKELVELGRYPYRRGLFGGRDPDDGQMVIDAINEVGLGGFEERSLLTLSGGELQRAFIAQLFAQDPNVLILDEPTNNLDLIYQKEIFELLEVWVKKENRAIVSVVHDLGLARAFGTKAILLDEGRTVASGPIEEVFLRDNINSAYELDIDEWMKRLYSHWTGREER